MPVYHCCVPGCTSSTRKFTNLDKYPYMKDVKFFSLSKKSNPRARQQWISLIRREKSWVPNKYTRVCSCHFEPESSVPTLFPYNNYKKPCYSRKTSNSSQCDLLLVDCEDEDADGSDNGMDNCEDPHYYEEDDIPYVSREIDIQQDMPEGLINVKKVEHATQFPSLDHVYGTAPSSFADVEVQGAGVQTDTSMHDIKSMSDEIKRLQSKLNDNSTLLREAFTDTVTKSDENVRFYTGLPSLAMLLGIFNILTAKCSSLRYWSGQSSAQPQEPPNCQRNRHRKPIWRNSYHFIHELSTT